MKKILLNKLIAIVFSTLSLNMMGQSHEINKTNNYIAFGSLIMTSGIIMSQSTTQGHRVGIPCFMLGVTIFSGAKYRKKKLKTL